MPPRQTDYRGVCVSPRGVRTIWKVPICYMKAFVGCVSMLEPVQEGTWGNLQKGMWVQLLMLAL